MKRKPSLCSTGEAQLLHFSSDTFDITHYRLIPPACNPGITDKVEMCCRLLTSKQQEAREPKQKRPYLATEVHDVVEADKWRQQILREIGRKVMEIQNAGLGDHRYYLFSSPSRRMA